MRKIVILPLLSACALLAILMCFSYRTMNTPPDPESLERYFNKNNEDIQRIVEFMIKSGYDNVYIESTEGTMHADLEWVEICNDAVSDSILAILGNEKYLSISKSGNTIIFVQWRGIQDIECGIVYTANGQDEPHVNYLTELIPLEKNGWFYYVSDYEGWRAGVRPS